MRPAGQNAGGEACKEENIQVSDFILFFCQTVIHLYSDLLSFHYNSTKHLRWTTIIPQAFHVLTGQILVDILSLQVIKGDLHPYSLSSSRDTCGMNYYPTGTQVTAEETFLANA